MRGIYPDQHSADYELALERALILARSGSPANLSEQDMMVLLQALFKKVSALETEIVALKERLGSTIVPGQVL